MHQDILPQVLRVFHVDLEMAKSVRAPQPIRQIAECSASGTGGWV